MVKKSKILSDKEKAEYVVFYFSAAMELLDKFGQERDKLKQDTVFSNSIAHLFLLGGEAAGDIKQDVQNRHPEIEWKKIKSVRNELAHCYTEHQIFYALEYESYLPQWVEAFKVLAKELDDMELLSAEAAFIMKLKRLCGALRIQVSMDELEMLFAMPSEDAENKGRNRLEFWSMPVGFSNKPLACFAMDQGLLDHHFEHLMDIVYDGEPILFYLARLRSLPKDFEAWNAISPKTGNSLAHTALYADMLPKGFDRWNIWDQNGMSVACAALNRRRLPLDFRDWHVMNSDGETAAHYAALRQMLPDCFCMWNLTNLDGIPVALYAVREQRIFPQDPIYWLLGDRTGWTVAHEMAAQELLPQDFPAEYFGFRTDDGESVLDIAIQRGYTEGDFDEGFPVPDEPVDLGL